ncbi:TrgA family protein [Seohaeicola saemankumensis]|uniref:TrgA family protein n=1 Tax=Seohaeicola saemankumensis TaxID=481181 RepID=UPI001E4E229B|nr:TrgA family protein [Seohaeicola saemankumensis]MCD1624715.1 TrgA family protein [Seohaeicola saemankumensis]
MLTAPRLVAAIVLAVVGYLASDLIKPLLPEDKDFGYFSFVNAALGAATGWIVIGKRVGRGISPAIGHGFTAAAALIFWGLFVQSGNEMLRLALRRRFDGPLEALTDMLRIGLEFAVTMSTVPVLGTLFLGGVVAAILAEFASRHWR